MGTPLCSAIRMGEEGAPQGVTGWRAATGV